MSYRNYFISLSILTAATAVIVALVNFVVPFFRAFQLFTWCSLIFFFGLSALAFYVGWKGIQKKSGAGFVASANGMLVLKLFLSVAFIIAYAVIVHPPSIAFISSFFTLYVVFTVFNIRQLLRASNLHEKKLKAANE